MPTGISFSGLSSGLDTDSIVTALTQAETASKTALQTKQNTLKLRQTAYATVKSQMNAVARAAGTLNTASAFATVGASVGDSAVATLTATSSASVGSYDLIVTSLAKANKVATTPQADATSALGKAGSASVNGKSFAVEAGDSLTSVAKKINGLGAGVTASIVDGGVGKAYLTLSATATGAASSVSLADLSGSALSDLGLIGAGASVRQTSGNAAVGTAFSSKTDSLATMLGASDMAPSTLTIGGATVSIDPSADTLESLATKINGAGATGVTATVQAGTKDGATVYSLQISGDSAVPSIAESGSLLRGLGILRAAPANELVGGKDAVYSLDGVPLTSSSNTITTAISGATLTLKKADATSLSLTQDDSSVKSNVGAFVSAVNDMLGTIKTYSSFDKSTFQTGVLFGDALATQAKDSVRSLLFTDTPGVSGTLKNLASVGFGLDTDGNVTLDGAKFQSALDSNPDGVAALFQSMGKGSTASIKYVSATATAQASSAAGYSMVVSQAATKASFVAGTAQTGVRTSAETLTFKGPAFGSSSVAVDFEAGTGLSATVGKINADSRLKDLVTASVENGKLRIDAKKYGTPGNFTLTSNYSSSGGNSGVGVGGEGMAVVGLDVAGTINGEAATGNGQFLTGVAGNKNTEGLQVQYSGVATGAVGTIAFSRGAASRMSALVTSFTDSIKGQFTAADKGLQNQIDGLDKDMTTIDDRITSKTAELKARFSAMESALAQLKSQSNTLASMLGTSTTS